MPDAGAKVPDSPGVRVPYCPMSLTDYRPCTTFEVTGIAPLAELRPDGVSRARHGYGEDVPPAAAPSLIWQWPLRMVNPVRRLPWGSRTALAQLQGRPSAASPEAELCMGALASADSMLVDLDGQQVSMREAIEADPLGLLGAECHRRYGTRLPFQLRVLAVGRPQPVRVHPAQSVVSADGDVRWADPFGRCELVVAVEPFRALAGLRDPWRAGELLDLLDIAPLLPMRRALTAAAGSGRGRAGTLDALVRLAAWPLRQRAVLAAGVSDAARAVLVDPRTRHDRDTCAALEWVARLADRYPDDPMVLAPLLMDLVELEAGDALFVPAGVPYTYLSGVAVAAAAASDNLVNAGLTGDGGMIGDGGLPGDGGLVDPAALQRSVDPAVGPETVLAWGFASPHEEVAATPAPEFRLSRVTVPDGSLVTLGALVPGPQLLFCLGGEIQVWSGARQVTLTGGESAWIGPEAGDCLLSGDGVVYRLTVGLC